MELRALALDFSGNREWPEGREIMHMDLRRLPGTDGYCSEEASCVLREKIFRWGYQGIHFLDSGNYHYLTKFFLEQIEEPFQLVVFDHHTDMQPSALRPLLSCGNWLLETLMENRNLRRVLLIGPPEEAASQIPAGFEGRLALVSAEKLSACGNVEEALAAERWDAALYLSIDKDVLCREDARTNWDQGEMRLPELCRFLRVLGERAEILGIDICGAEIPNTAEAEAINSRTDRRLMECIDKIPNLRR